MGSNPTPSARRSVVAGRTLFHPFDGWATISVEGTDDVVAACAHAVDRNLERHRIAAVTAAREVLTRAGLEPVPLAANAHRVNGRLHVQVIGELPAGQVQTMMAARVGAALRTLDPDAELIAVSFSPADGP